MKIEFSVDTNCRNDLQCEVTTDCGRVIPFRVFVGPSVGVAEILQEKLSRELAAAAPQLTDAPVAGPATTEAT